MQPKDKSVRACPSGANAGIEMILSGRLHATGRDLVSVGCGGRACGAVVDPSGYRALPARRGERYADPLRHDTHNPCRSRVSGRRLASAPVRDMCRRKPRQRARLRRCATGLLELGNVSSSSAYRDHPEHVSLLVTAQTRATSVVRDDGSYLMVGDVGRTELAATAEEGAQVLFASLGRLKACPTTSKCCQVPSRVGVRPGLSGKPFSQSGSSGVHTRIRIDEEAEFLASFGRYSGTRQARQSYESERRSRGKARSA